MREKDIKLLWGRSGNRCAVCKIELSQDSSTGNSSYPIGEQAHIVGEKAGSARWKSSLSLEERNSYHNMILLCPNHHTEIDKSEEDWSIEKLYVAKSMHELWVRESLSSTADIRAAASELAVSSIVDAAVNLLDLNEWKIWTSGPLSIEPTWESMRAEKIFEFRQRVEAAIWPKEYSELMRATKTLATGCHFASKTFHRHSVYQQGVYWPEKFYRKYGVFNPNYEEDLSRYTDWLDECKQSMIFSTKAANWFADVVRRDVNPSFMVENGRFVALDDTGIEVFAKIPLFLEIEKDCLPDRIEDFLQKKEYEKRNNP